ncbi:hypothetical protein [Streptomyces griseosporeus]|uniref:hypothetical protein n=1 Tax=Streptomyces griseosporeus TaxID=1910 RepID=UPI0036B4E172
MDPLVATAGTAVVAAMATDAWQQARTAVLQLWRRTHPERVPAIEGELAEVREDVLTARTHQDAEAEERLVENWRQRLERLVRTDPALVSELQRLVNEELVPLLPSGALPRPGSTTMEIHSGDHCQNHQVNGDITITTGKP